MPLSVVHHPADAAHQFPLPLDVAVAIVLLGMGVFLLIAYDLYRNDDPFSTEE